MVIEQPEDPAVKSAEKAKEAKKNPVNAGSRDLSQNQTGVYEETEPFNFP